MIQIAVADANIRWGQQELNDIRKYLKIILLNGVMMIITSAIKDY